MRKPIVFDIGELGWSLYLVAHLRFLWEYYDYRMSVMTYPDRKCLYKNVAEGIFDVPESFYKEFDTAEQECFGIESSSNPEMKRKLKTYFEKMIAQLPCHHADEYYIPPGFEFTCKMFGFVFTQTPFEYSVKLPDYPQEILVFPRARPGRFSPRNIPRDFYVRLIKRLCDEFPTLVVRTVGALSGAYKIQQKEINKALYLDGVEEKPDLQGLINLCQTAVCAVGSQSAPPKITLMQGVPTFMIGHEEGRHTEKENWMKTKAGFYMVTNYSNFDFGICINEIIEFIRSCINASPIIVSPN